MGVSEALGIRLAENFKTPYFASSIADFWRRWHITLGTWFRNYLYYPLLRSRLFTASGKKIAKLSNKKTSRLITSVLGLGITWLLIGMWHGSSVHYVIYGLYHGTFIIMETLFGSFYQKTKKWLKISDKNIVWRAFQILRTFMIVCFGYIFFRASSMTAVLTIIRKIFTDISFSAAAMETFYTATRVYLSTFQIHIINYSLIFLLLIEIIEARSALFVWFNKQPLLVRWLCLYLLIGATLFLGCYGSNDASSFIYFQF
ncbi:Peptidoglycan O-acetyltransferase [bioreactor metagenome]|uniref:Peptidoglycan O-acetyltransferase n=1 Tax=bioreactor metagenome TaxID=1076179 RepID=A0A645BEW3_9ZZZZ